MATLTILAPGRCLPEEIKKYGIVGDVMAVNQVIADYAGPIKYAVCWWDKYLKLLLAMREIRNYSTKDTVLISRPLSGKFPINNSGLMALDAANSLKQYDCVRVLGMPVDDSGHYFDLDPTCVHDSFFPLRFFFNCETEWTNEFAGWKNKFKVSSGNLLRYFDNLQPKE